MALCIASTTIGRRGLGTICRRSAQLHHLSSVATKATAVTASSTNTIYNNANINNLTHLHHNCNGDDAFNKQQTALRNLSSTPPSTGYSQPGNITTDQTIGEEERNKSIFSKLWDKYSFEGQKKRIVLGERLFRAAQYRASDP